RLVEQDEADAAAEDDAQRRPYQEVVDVRLLDQQAGMAREVEAVAPAEDEADDVGQRVPADDEGAELEQHRVDCRERQGEEHRMTHWTRAAGYRRGGEEPQATAPGWCCCRRRA